MPKLTVIIPSKTECFLQRTTEDVLQNATGDIEIIVVLDGYELPEPEIITDPRVRYITLPSSRHTQKRQAINRGVAESTGEYVMSLDAHCLVANGFDEQLITDHQPNWVQIPRRHRLDAERWDLQPQGDNRPPIDYEYIMFRPLIAKDNLGVHGFKWDDRTNERINIPIDDTLTFQGSCWFMTKDWFTKMGFMDLAYTGWGQEAEEISFTTWKNGGRVVTNKNTYYAHLHKGAKYGRMYWMSREENRKSYAYSSDLWLNKNHDFIVSLVEKFMPMPGWPSNWRELL